MSYNYPASKNKRSKVDFKQYLYNSGEPDDDTANDAALEHEPRLQQQSEVMRRKIRRDARRLRVR